jgi:pimeloyl-ACP methyl ester carboxylesterase
MQRNLRALAVVVLALASLMAACGRVDRPDLKRLYETMQPSPQPPVILIPGVFGSRLRDRETGEEVWPGGWRKLLFSSYTDLALEIDPETLLPKPSRLEAFDITEAALGQEIYGPIMRTLEQAGGYVRTQPGTPLQDPHERRYYVLSYDWRLDNLQSARALDTLIGRIRADYRDPGLKVDIIAHSMGGLVARYYLRYGTADLLDGNDFPVTQEGARRVRNLILLGTPNLGSILSLHGFLEGYPVVLGRVPTEVFATMPSAPQLFPHPINDWIITPAGKPLDRDLFDAETWRRFGWSVFNPQVAQRIAAAPADPAAGRAQVELLQRYFAKHLERARRFVWSLTVKEESSPIHYVVFGGDCELTPARVLVEEDGGDSAIRLYPGQIRQPQPGVDYGRLMLEPGDGSVTKASLLARQSLDPGVARHKYSYFPLAYAFFLCEEHTRLTGNVSFQDNLLNVLLTRTHDFQQAR